MKKSLFVRLVFALLLIKPISSYCEVNFNGLNYMFSLRIPDVQQVILLFSFDNYTKQYHMEEDPYERGHFKLTLDTQKIGNSVKPGKYFYRVIADGIMTYDVSNPNVDILPDVGKLSYFIMKDQYLDTMSGPFRIAPLTYRFFYHCPVGKTPTQVFLIGSFTSWNLYQYIFKPMEDNPRIWYTDVKFDKPIDIQYLIVVDGAWISDINNPNTVRNAAGQDVSVLQVQ